MSGLQPARFDAFSKLMWYATAMLMVHKFVIIPTKRSIKDNDVDGFDNNVLAIVKSLHWTGVQHISSDRISDSCVGNKKIITVDVKAH